MAGRPDKNSQVPKGRLHGMLTSMLGNYFGGVQTGDPTGVGNTDMPDAAYLQQTNGEMPVGNNAPALGQYTSVSQIPQVTLGQRPGLGNIGTWLSAGTNVRNYDAAKMQLANAAYTGQVHEVLQQQAKQAALADILAKAQAQREQFDYEMPRKQQYTLEEIAAKRDAANAQAVAAEAAKLGVAPEELTSVLGPYSKAKYAADTTQENIRGGVLGTPDGATAFAKGLYDNYAKQGFENELNHANAEKAYRVNVGAGDFNFDSRNPALGVFNRPFESQPSASPVGPIQMTPDGTIAVPRLKTPPTLPQTKVNANPLTPAQQPMITPPTSGVDASAIGTLGGDLGPAGAIKGLGTGIANLIGPLTVPGWSKATPPTTPPEPETYGPPYLHTPGAGLNVDLQRLLQKLKPLIGY